MIISLEDPGPIEKGKAGPRPELYFNIFAFGPSTQAALNGASRGTTRALTTDRGRQASPAARLWGPIPLTSRTVRGTPCPARKASAVSRGRPPDFISETKGTSKPRPWDILPASAAARAKPASASPPERRAKSCRLIIVPYAKRPLEPLPNDSGDEGGIDKIASPGRVWLGRQLPHWTQGPTFLIEHIKYPEPSQPRPQRWRDFDGDFGDDLPRSTTTRPQRPRSLEIASESDLMLPGLRAACILQSICVGGPEALKFGKKPEELWGRQVRPRPPKTRPLPWSQVPGRVFSFPFHERFWFENSRASLSEYRRVR